MAILRVKQRLGLNILLYGRFRICFLAIVNVTNVTQCCDIKSSIVVVLKTKKKTKKNKQKNKQKKKTTTTKNKNKQVAHRATIAHLSPMCQGQTWSSAIKANHSKVNSPETLFSPLEVKRCFLNFLSSIVPEILAWTKNFTWATDERTDVRTT